MRTYILTNFNEFSVQQMTFAICKIYLFEKHFVAK